MKKILFFAIMVVAQQLYSQNSFLLHNVYFLDEELDVKIDSSEYYVSWHSNFPPTNYRFIFIEFSIDSQYNLHSKLPFDLSLYCTSSNDTIPLEICDTLYYENGKTFLRAYCAVKDNSIPGGRELILKDVFCDYTHIVDSMKQSWIILYYDKYSQKYSNIRIPQIDVISPRIPYLEKIIFHKCYCPIKESLFKESLFENYLMPIED